MTVLGRPGGPSDLMGATMSERSLRWLITLSFFAASAALWWPVSAALAMFNTNTLFRILIEGHSREGLAGLKARVLKTLIARHDGEEDGKQPVDQRLVLGEVEEEAFQTLFPHADDAVLCVDHAAIAEKEHADGVFAFGQVGGKDDVGPKEGVFGEFHRALQDAVAAFGDADAFHGGDEFRRVAGFCGGPHGADRTVECDAVAQVVGVREDGGERAGGGDGIEAGGGVDMDGVGVDPDAGAAVFLADRHGGGGAFDGDDDFDRAVGGGGVAFDRAVDEDFGAVEIGSDGDAVLAKARDDAFGMGGRGEEEKGEGEVLHGSTPGMTE